jgi:CubicO group peptidase (beta-lactamase class C family)
MRVVVVALTIALLLSACQPEPEPAEPVVVHPAELQAFADEFFPGQMEELHIPGLTFVFIQGGEVIYAQGYGSADLETATPVDAGSTVMRIGSVSKIFVATAVMQLVEQGQLDLHTDINQYLTTFQLERKYSQPVTLAHLLTHTGGFEDPPYTSNVDPEQREPLAAHLAANMPPPSHRPGKENIYSNYGYALAGLVVEEVSGLPFDQYVDQNIFEPLGMTHSHYLLSPPLPENLATGYFYQDGVQIRQPVDYDDDYPGGSIVSTAPEMAQFMLAHLQDGCTERGCILQAATVAEMHARQGKAPFKDQHVTYGFLEGSLEGQRLLGYGGAIRGFGSSLKLLPDHDAGYFFSFNEECWQTLACGILSEFRQAFAARFFSQ